VPLRGILLLVFLLPSLPVCFVRPFYGVVLWTIVAFTSVQWYAYSAREFPVALMVAIPTLLGAVLFTKGWRNVLSREVILLFILWIWFTITTIVSTGTPLFADHADAAWYRWGTVSKVLLMTVATVAIVDSFARLRTLVIVIASCFGVFVLKALPFLITHGGGERVYGPELSMIADNNDFGLALNMTLPLFFFLAQSESSPRLKRLFWILTIATVPTIFFTYSRGALIGLVAIAGVMFLGSKQRKILIPLFIMGVAVAFLYAPEDWRHRMDPTRENPLDGSAYSRINAWTFSWHLASDYPLTGGGFETFTRELFYLYAPNANDVKGPHSVYFGVLGEHGFVGLFLYLALVCSCFASIHWVVKWGHYHGDEVAVHYGNMFRVALTAFLISGLFLGRAYFDYYFTLVACIVILRCVCQSEWSKAGVEQQPLEMEVAA
jgi:putative inorganic carbon (HCO3(-)) transporter